MKKLINRKEIELVAKAQPRVARLIKLLKANRLYTAYIKALMKDKISVNNFTEIRSEGLIDSLFTWGSTEIKVKRWIKTHYKWIKICKKESL